MYLTAALGTPLAYPVKVVQADPREMRILEPDPELAMRRLTPVVEEAAAASNAVGHIVYRSLVDTYTDAAIEAGDRSSAQERRMLELFKQRDVIAPVVAEVEERAREIQ
jgi:hypothetical protein